MMDENVVDDLLAVRVFETVKLNLPVIKVGDALACVLCKGVHILEMGKDPETGELAEDMLVMNCHGKKFLVGIENRLVAYVYSELLEA